MSLAASINKFKSDISDAAARNAAHSRPSSTAPPRTSTPKPTDNKRTHEAAFSQPTTSSGGHSGTELLTQVWNAVKYLREKDRKPIPFDALIGYLSLPNDAQKNIPFIKRALLEHERVEYVPKSESGKGKECFKYRPQHPVTNAEELKAYLSTLPTAQGIPVRELKDGWPDCGPALNTLEDEGHILLTRKRKDNTPVNVYFDSPAFHILDPVTSMPERAEPDFVDAWSRTKLPASEGEIRAELEKAGLTPTSLVREVRRVETKRKEKRRVSRKGGKTTNSHLLGILKDYSRR